MSDQSQVVIMAIRQGYCDDDLDVIADVLRRRQALKAAERVNELSVTDIVRISQNVRPKLLSGARVQITEFDKDKVKGILLDYCSPKWRNGNQITLPASLVGPTIQGV